MSYKEKSLIYLICFIASVLLYAHMETSMEETDTGDVQLVQTENGPAKEQADPAL